MKLNVNCPINTVSYGYVSSYFLIGLNKLGYDTKHIPIGPNTPDENLVGALSPIISRRDFFYNADCLKIWHQHSLHGFTGKGKKIGFPIFELEDFTDEEKHSLNYCDEIIVCSNWAKSVIEFNLQRVAHVVPLGYDPSIFKLTPLSLHVNDPVTIFANFGKFELRKGHDILSQAFNAAFEKDDNVSLVMMPSNPFLNQEETNFWLKQYMESKLSSKIQMIPRLKTQSEVYNVMRQVHCGVFPARAEGWNLEALELLACGRHLIITNCTGHTEFCNQENSFLINCESGYEKAVDNKFFHGQGRWNKFTENEFDQLVEHLRSVHQMNMNGELKTNINAAHGFTWMDSTQKLDTTLKGVCNATT